jgi:hypothetical protein
MTTENLLKTLSPFDPGHLATVAGWLDETGATYEAFRNFYLEWSDDFYPAGGLVDIELIFHDFVIEHVVAVLQDNGHPTANYAIEARRTADGVQLRRSQGVIDDLKALSYADGFTRWMLRTGSITPEAKKPMRPIPEPRTPVPAPAAPREITQDVTVEITKTAPVETDFSAIRAKLF